MNAMRLNQKHKIRLITMDSFSKFVDAKNYELSYTMFSIPGENEDMLETSKNQNKAFMKVNFFIKSILDNSITYTVDETEKMKAVFGEFDNNFVTLPDFAETTLLETIHCKMSVLCGEGTFIDQISLTDLDTEVGYDLVSQPKPEYNLPEIVDWISDFSLYTLPWWLRYDTSTFDGEAVDDAALEEFRAKLAEQGGESMPLALIDGEINSMYDGDDDHKNNRPGELIDLAEAKEKKASWKPKIV